ncbi:MAG: polysaccharide deacetylase family protein, partial [Planctomycetes bacterium]|nr:polysaccharide deacetylase family protein [Planctomycetota bacterium]
MPAPRALLIDASEWFHDPAWREHLSKRHWRRLDSRAAMAIERAAALCERLGARATFFVGGAVAERCPDVLRRLVAMGHEIGNAGHEPVDLDAVPVESRAAVFAAWERSRQAIEAATGRRVRGFRAPWPPSGASWWREGLAAAGYAYDATAAGGAGQAGVEPLSASRADASFAVASFAAWELDVEQPRLGALPALAQRAHYERLRGAARRLEAAIGAGARAPIADVLLLPTERVQVAMPVRETPR